MRRADNLRRVELDHTCPECGGTIVLYEDFDFIGGCDYAYFYWKAHCEDCKAFDVEEVLHEDEDDYESD